METRIVLFVDDEVNLLKSMERSFKTEPYETLFASSGVEALEMLQREQVHVIVSDLNMPGMSGMELLSSVKNKYPQIVRMILTGHTDTSIMLGAINQGQIYKYIVKPWRSQEELKTNIRQAIEYYDLHSEREMLADFFEMWIEGVEIGEKETEFLKSLLDSRKQQLYDWQQKCKEIPLAE